MVPTAKDVGDWEAMALSIMGDLGKVDRKWLRDQSMLRNRVTGKGGSRSERAAGVSGQWERGGVIVYELGGWHPDQMAMLGRALQKEGIPFAWGEHDRFHLDRKYKTRVDAIIEAQGGTP